MRNSIRWMKTEKFSWREGQALGSYSGLTGEWLAAGITEIDGTTYLYTESYSNALFANGFYLGYDFYEYTKDGAFRPCMSVCKSDGGSSGIAYSVLQREGEEKWQENGAPGRRRVPDVYRR